MLSFPALYGRTRLSLKVEMNYPRFRGHGVVRQLLLVLR
jgi:hypothetical protein